MERFEELFADVWPPMWPVLRFPEDYRRVERAAGMFRRTVSLPVEVELDKVTASDKDGILEIREPKVEGAEPKGRKVEVG